MKKGAFTLVELIVVITILAILATIGFVSFSGYLAWTRDTNRVAQLKSMSDALELYSTKKSLPIPDDKVDIKAGTKTIAYQWYIWKNVLETIEYTESWLDPKDKGYFSYYLTKNKKYFQLLAFLEEESEDVLASIRIWVHNVQATDYADRFPKVTGKKLWILTDLDKTPIQDVSAVIGSWYLDTKTATWYIAHLGIGRSLSWREVSALYEISLEWWYKDSLVAWYNMEDTDENGNLLDLTWLKHFGVPTVANFPIWDVEGIIWKASGFSWPWGLEVPFFKNLHKRQFTISVWAKSDGLLNNYQTIISQWDCTVSCNQSWRDWWFGLWVGSTVINNPYFILGSERFNPQTDGYNFPYMWDWKWHHYVTTKNNKELAFYVDGKLIILKDSLAEELISPLSLYIGTSWHTRLLRDRNWPMDEVRIYSKMLGLWEIRDIYKLGR